MKSVVVFFFSEPEALAHFRDVCSYFAAPILVRCGLTIRVFFAYPPPQTLFTTRDQRQAQADERKRQRRNPGRRIGRIGGFSSGGGTYGGGGGSDTQEQRRSRGGGINKRIGRIDTSSCDDAGG